MFRFDFEIDEDDLSDPGLGVQEGIATLKDTSQVTQIAQAESAEKQRFEEPYRAYAVDELLATLPPEISFSPLSIPLASTFDDSEQRLSASRPSQVVNIARRDLFDARFQLISLEDHDSDANPSTSGLGVKPETALEFVDAPSDLVPGMYEGGFKTWECALDLVGCLHRIFEKETGRRLKGKKILELGCGTAVPSLYILNRLFSSEPSQDSEEPSDMHIHLQDYNPLVLRLVTMANVLLAWYMSPASQAFRDSVASAPDADSDTFPPADPSTPGTLSITPALKDAFLASLRSHRVHLGLLSGSWATLDLSGAPYDVVFTSETIYRPESLPALIKALRDACLGEAGLEDAAARMSFASAEPKQGDGGGGEENPPHLCLVAAKRVYFGVGGGVSEFVNAVEGLGANANRVGSVQTVWEHTDGVKRIVMQVKWVV
ncbi:hypothetical protein WOLCODRAFT_139183, partial [Wolfiporia cocos MD-104 SS10]